MTPREAFDESGPLPQTALDALDLINRKDAENARLRASILSRHSDRHTSPPSYEPLAEPLFPITNDEWARFQMSWNGPERTTDEKPYRLFVWRDGRWEWSDPMDWPTLLAKVREFKQHAPDTKLHAMSGCIK